MRHIAPPEVFELDRIRLRRPRVSDADAIFAYGSDPEVARYADWPVRTERDTLVASLRERRATWEAGVEYSWVITLADEDRAIGGVSCFFDGPEAEIGFLLHRQYWGQGLATEAARAVVKWILSQPTISRVFATCDAENVASARVLEKLGLSREATLHRAIVRPNISPEPRDAFLYALKSS